MKRIFLMLCLLIFVIGSVSAFDIAYVLKNSNSQNQQFIESINDLGYTYELIDDSDISTTNFSKYEIILINDENIKNVPINEHKSLVVSPDYHDGWSSRGGSIASSQPLRAKNINTEISITKNLPEEFQVYTRARLNGISIPMYYLSGRKYDTERVTSTINDLENFVMAIKQNPKRVFFGITFTEYWTEDSKQLFENSIVWLMDGEYNYPEFGGNCNKEILEDYEEICEFNLSDFGDEFVFSIVNENNLNCEINENELKYKSFQDHNGEANCLIKAEDDHGETTFIFEINITPVNDAPVINYFFPEQENLTIVENKNQYFMLEASDVDSVLEINWFVDDVGVCSKEDYTFNKEQGNYIVKAILSDGEFYLNKLWNVIVGSSSEFTCSEVGGNICSEDQICPEETINVKDTNNCCLVSCIKKPLEFSDAEECYEKDDLIEITIKEPDKDDEFEIGETMKVEVKIKNKFDEKLDFKIETHLYDLDEDESIEEVKEEIKIKSGKSETIEMEINIPKNVEDNDFVIYVFVEDEENRCNSKYAEIKIERKKHEVIIKNIEIPEKTISPGKDLEINVEIENIGMKEEDVYIQIENTELNISEKTEEFEIEEYGEDNEETKTFHIKIPESAEEKEYGIKVTIIFDDGQDSKREYFEVLKKSKKDYFGSATQYNEIISLGEKGEMINLGGLKKDKKIEIVVKPKEVVLDEKRKDLIKDFLCGFNSSCKYPPCINHIVLIFILLGGIMIVSALIILVKRRRN